MLLGLCNAPAAFERLMERVLSAVPRSCCVVYLDDLLVHASSFEHVLANLHNVLAAIRQAGLRLNPPKCQLLRRETAFLGYVVSERGVATHPAKVTAVQDWRTTALTEAPVLAYPDVHRPFIVDTDASNVGVGAVLSQEDSDGERAVAYYSGALSRAEQNYCVTHRELLAVVKALRHFRPYLHLPVSAEGPELKAYYGQWRSLELRDRLVYPRWQAPGLGSDLLQLLVPRAIHFGNSKTLRRLRGRFY
ncbi:hypothetical protein AAFF_G00026600 [Aldrovandia affinis]|uniref:ribonuclease H n=1 Tax=Aldrovandia affinis TaxID=143900 RepID=A0AAD7WGB6_9TELE|nr:hypothetical protein AAFF_G00026600 [Aldrovandia affinis]